MLPIVQLRHVTRDDVQRIARWLSDDEVSSRWFGHLFIGVTNPGSCWARQQRIG